MRAIQIERTGGPDVMQLVDVPVPVPGPGEVRVFDMVTTGKVKIEIGRRCELEAAAQAHRDLEARTTTGSALLIP
jgi:NADPH:quinone reductase-like Zn-dependent oxidoreductase